MEVANKLYSVLDSKVVRWALFVLLGLISVILSVKVGVIALLYQFLQSFEKWALLQLSFVAVVSLLVNGLLIACVLLLLKRKIQQ